MSSKITCRCCLTSSADKDLKARNKWLGETEVYAEMLKECYDIHIKIGKKPTDRGICSSCILRLRDALTFKRQVLNCLKEFENHLQNGLGIIKDEIKSKCFKPIQIKQEGMEVGIEADYSQQQNDTEDHDLKEECSDEDDVEDDKALASLATDRLTEKQATTKEITTKKLLKVKSIKSDLKEELSDQDDVEDDKALASLATNRLTEKQATTKKVTTKKLLKVKSIKSEHKIIVSKPVNVTINEPSASNTSSALKHNISNIMKYSNVTPFYTVSYNGIECADCKETQKDLESLKLHNTTHDNIGLALLNKKDATRQPFKLDITDLKCNLCDHNFDVISNLKKHLIDKHDIKFYDVKDTFLEFKLSYDSKLDCALCSSSFETFKTLLQHMNGHYRNYMCNECGSGFIKQHQLRKHKKTHVKSEFKCSHCDKVFNTTENRYYHEKCVHSASKTRVITKCLLCSESFTGYYKRNSHMMKVHKTSPADYRCNICDRTFVVKRELTRHIKNKHLMEKNHSCEECGMQFYSKERLKNHMVKHNGLKIFNCSVCTKSYTRKSVLREHMRIHMNDRRFKCGLCELAFVQKCSLKGHMLSNHGMPLSVNENMKSQIEMSRHEKTDQCELENSSSVVSG